MLIRATSDLHGNLPQVERCDLLLIGGDIFPIADHDLSFQQAWLHQVFRPWLSSLPASRVVGIAGNHDFLFQSDPASAYSLPWDYLCDQIAEINGLRVWGTPWVEMSPRWAFHASGADMQSKLALMPKAEIMLCHSPPLGLGDRLWNGRSVGSKALLDFSRHSKAVVCGHIHEAYGAYRTDWKSYVYNVSLCDEQYRPVNPPVEILL